MTDLRKHRGYASQRIVADYLRSNGWPYAEFGWTHPLCAPEPI
jgi:hypothetical protein